jgi:hypothetical protein
MNTHTIDLGAEFGTDLSSRHRASELRVLVECRLASGDIDRVAIDLSNVRTVSHSFADELFAVLVIDHGEQWFKEHVAVAAPSAPVRQTILEAIQLRLEKIPA